MPGGSVGADGVTGTALPPPPVEHHVYRAGLALEELLDPGDERGAVGANDDEQAATGIGAPEPYRHPAESSAQQHRQRFPGSREAGESVVLASRRSRCVQHSPWTSRSSP